MLKQMKKILLLLTILFATGAARAFDLPQILSEQDAATYTEIFATIDANHPYDSIKLEKNLSDKILLPEVQYQRFMSKYYYTKHEELAEWLKKNPSHPGADTLYKLAKKKGSGWVRYPALPQLLSASDETAYSENFTSKKYSSNINSKINEFKRYLKRGKTLNAKTVLEDNLVKARLTKTDYGRLAGRLAFMYYADARFDLAREWGQIGSDAHSEYGLWTMGLLSYKDGDFATAEKLFAEMSELKHINDARKVEALFWAGRAASAMDENRRAKKYWKVARKNPQTFYGALSTKMLGSDPDYDFFDADLEDEDIAELMKYSYGMRGLALLQIGQRDAAERQFRYLASRDATDSVLHAVHAIATAEELPRLALRMGRIVRARGIGEIDPEMVSNAQYPLPDWKPLKGWGIDRALIFAIIRQESAFKPNAKSTAGAQGVMQLMPQTAKTVARRNKVNINTLDMSNPEHNVFLGQKLIGSLLQRNHIDNNLVKLLVSYNSGEGRMVAWEKKFKTDDPLLFIESYPAKETREYVKHVMANLWLYRARLDQSLTSMADMADGKWPVYSPSDEIVKDEDADERNSNL
jgi:soluble lytic murein transglycosylase-like protein